MAPQAQKQVVRLGFQERVQVLLVVWVEECLKMQLMVWLTRSPQKGSKARNEPDVGVVLGATFGGLADFTGLRTPLTNAVKVSKG